MKLFSLTSHLEKAKTDNYVNWNLLIFPASKRTIGISLLKATDGFWTTKGKPRKFFVSGTHYWKFTIKAYQFWIKKSLVELPLDKINSLE